MSARRAAYRCAELVEPARDARLWIGECLPRFFILENVKGLLSMDDGKLIAEMVPKP